MQRCANSRHSAIHSITYCEHPTICSDSLAIANPMDGVFGTDRIILNLATAVPYRRYLSRSSARNLKIDSKVMEESLFVA
jgi:hypothetical protein